MAEFFTGPLLPQAQSVFLWAVFLGTVLIYFLDKEARKIKFKKIIWILVGFRIFYAALQTFGQYHVWQQNFFTQFLLPPHRSPVYFLIYVGTRFWLGAVLSVGVAFLFYLFLKALEKHRERYFEWGDIELGMISALLAGWPKFVILIPLVFVFVALISLVRMVVWKEPYTTLGAPFLLGTLACFLSGAIILSFFNLGVLKI